MFPMISHVDLSNIFLNLNPCPTVSMYAIFTYIWLIFMVTYIVDKLMIPVPWTLMGVDAFLLAFFKERRPPVVPLHAKQKVMPLVVKATLEVGRKVSWQIATPKQLSGQIITTPAGVTPNGS